MPRVSDSEVRRIRDQRRQAEFDIRTILRAEIEDDPVAGEGQENEGDLFADADITREEYVGRKRALVASLNAGLPQPTYSEAVLVRAARLLADLGELDEGHAHRAG